MPGGGVGWAGCGSSQFVGGLGGRSCLPLGLDLGGNSPALPPSSLSGCNIEGVEYPAHTSNKPTQLRLWNVHGGRRKKKPELTEEAAKR